MAMDYVETSKKIIEGVGGAENIASATHCMTRLRLVLNDESKANDAKVNKIKGVKSVIKQGGQYQVVIGNEVSNLFKEFSKLGNFGGEGKAAAAPKAKGNAVQRLFGFVAGCMTPMLPAMLGAGMLKVVLTLLTTFCGMDATGSTYTLIYSFADAFFLFLPIFLGMTIAKKMGGNPMLFMLVGAALCYPNLTALMSGENLGKFLGMDCTYLFGLPVICATYTSSVLPMLLMAPVMKWAEDFGDRVSPNVLKAFLKPLIFIIICIPCVLYVLGPLGNVAGNMLSNVFTVMYNTAPWLTVGVLSAAMPFIVMTGMHYALIPLFMNNIATLGYDVIVLVTMFCSNLAQGGASLGVAVKSKDSETRSEGIACGISAIIAGVTEPAMYGINLRYMTPMIGAVIAAGVGGLFTGITGVKGYTMGGSPSILSLITFIGGESPMRGVIFGAIAAVIILAISFVLSFMLFKDPAKDEDEEAEEAGEAAGEAEKKSLGKEIMISAPLTGQLVDLGAVPDEVFASGALGEGIAIMPSAGVVVAPCDGKVTATMETNHAVGITTPEGAELLIHVGLDTVSLGGKHYKCFVSEGQAVKKGDRLIEFDMNAIIEEGYKLYTPVLVTNSDDFVSIKVVNAGSVKAGDDLLSVK